MARWVSTPTADSADDETWVDKVVKPQSAQPNTLSYAQRWMDRGVQLVGGCCGTRRRAHVEAIRTHIADVTH